MTDPRAEDGVGPQGPVGAWTAAGLYDPADARGDDRLALLRWLDEQGVTLEEMVRADANGRLFAVVGDRILRGTGERLTSEACADAAGMPHERFVAIWRALGFPDPPADAPLLTAEEAAVFSIVGLAESILGEASIERLVASISRAMRVIAEATITAFVDADDSTMLDRSGSEFVSAQVDALYDGMVPDFHRLLCVLHTLHHEAANRHLELALGPASQGTNTDNLAVAFADVSGYTSLAAVADAAELEAVVAGFDAWAADVVRRAGAQLVMTMGDGVMIVGAVAAVGRAALELVRPGSAPAGLRLHAGVAFGPMRATGGDYFGPTVNLAARLCGAADGGEVLADPAFAEAWRRHGDARERGEHRLKGIDEPVPVCVLVEATPG